MARRLSIDIADHNADGVCTESYLVQYKITGEPSYSYNDTQFTSPIVIDGLADGTIYTISITRTCCNGINSSPLVFNYNTLPISDNITGFSATGGAESISLNWDDLSGVDGYRLYMSMTNDINTSELIYTGTTSAYNKTGLNSSTTYYFWVQGYTNAGAASNFATTNATTF